MQPISGSPNAPGTQPTLVDRGEMPSTMSLPPLYNNVSSNVEEIDEVDPFPGPGSYDLPSSLGTQCKSHNASATEVSILARNICAKRYISKNHAVVQSGDVPGPGTYKARSLLLDLGTTFPKGSLDRKYATITTSAFCAYNPRFKRKDRSNAFSKQNRFNFDKETGDGVLACVGSYDVPIGRSNIHRTMGNSRKHWERVYIPGMDKYYMGTMTLQAGLGKQMAFADDDSAGVKFTQSKRKTMGAGSEAPGPGTYNDTDVFKTSKMHCFVSEIGSKPSYGFGKATRKSRARCGTLATDC